MGEDPKEVLQKRDAKTFSDKDKQEENRET